jgi:hypothetical protein
MKKSFSLLFSVVCITTHAQFQSVSINGVISFHEKRDTSDFKIIPASSESFLLKKNKDFYYVGIHNSTVAASNVILNKGREYIVIHISACTGRAIYQQITGDSFKVVKPIKDVRTNPEAWDVRGLWVSNTILKDKKDLLQFNNEMQSCLKQYGYMASTVDLGSYRDAEMLLDLKVFSGYRMLIQNTEKNHNAISPMNQYGFYPHNGYTDNSARMKAFLDAREGTSLKIELETENWILL